MKLIQRLLQGLVGIMITKSITNTMKPIEIH